MKYKHIKKISKGLGMCKFMLPYQELSAQKKKKLGTVSQKPHFRECLLLYILAVRAECYIFLIILFGIFKILYIQKRLDCLKGHSKI